jgi:hypothetical protein
MLVRLRDITLSSFVERVFAHAPPADGANPWYFGGVRFEIEPLEQLRHLTELFSSAHSLPDYGLSNAQIGVGLCCILGGAHNESFVSLLRNPAVPLALRRGAIDALFNLYDGLLTAALYEHIDFRVS